MNFRCHDSLILILGYFCRILPFITYRHYYDAYAYVVSEFPAALGCAQSNAVRLIGSQVNRNPRLRSRSTSESGNYAEDGEITRQDITGIRYVEKGGNRKRKI